MSGWIGVDLDGTLARYDGWRGIDHIGEPIPLMVERVKRWLAEGREVRIFTARVAVPEPERRLARGFIVDWCRRHVGEVLPITNIKDLSMIELWDDRAVSVGLNTGMRLDGRTE